MNSLTSAIVHAYETSGTLKEANKAYLEFIKANFIVPIERHEDDKAPVVLFLQEKEQLFLPVFTEKKHLDTWACDIAEEISVLKLSGVDLLKGIGDNVTVCLDIGRDHYKEFNPSELSRMKSMVLKFFKDQ